MQLPSAPSMENRAIDLDDPESNGLSQGEQLVFVVRNGESRTNVPKARFVQEVPKTVPSERNNLRRMPIVLLLVVGVIGMLTGIYFGASSYFRKQLSENRLAANNEETNSPSVAPTQFPTEYPTAFPSQFPTASPTSYPTSFPTYYPTYYYPWG